MLQGVDAGNPAANAELWERVVAKLRAGSMPPAGSPRPDAATYEALAGRLEAALDRAWAASPNPGRINAVHRLNRTEYKNAIRDLFALDVDVATLLPGDETADGSFDNFADVLTISTAHLERYLSVARQVTRQAIGLPPASPGLQRFEIPLHVVQDDRQSEDLPFGSRGGMAIPFHFPVNGEYLITIRLRRQYQDYIMGMGWPQQVDVRVDGRLLKRFTIGGNAPGRPAAASYAGDGEPGFAGAPEWEAFMQLTADAGLQVRVPIDAGSRIVGVSFVRQLFEPEGLPQPLQRGRVLTNDQIYMENASIGSVQIGGPFTVTGTAKDTASRRAIFSCQPASTADQACATSILSRAARLAYRRPVAPADVKTLLTFFDAGVRDGGTFDTGIQFALERMLVDPDFLLRVYHQPADVKAATYRLSDLELASRLSFFLWSSLPDDRLIDLAARGELSKPQVLDAQVRRMLADPKAADALVHDFAAQWLNLRRLTEVVVHPDFYPNFDESLLNGFREETELFVGSTLREDRSVLDLLRADYTFVNERVARHYGIHGRLRQPVPPRAAAATPPSAAACSRTGRFWRRRPIRNGRRRCCAASTSSTTSSACRCRRRPPAWTRRCPTSSLAPRRPRFASGCRSTATTPCAAVATRRSIRRASPSSSSMRSAAGAHATRRDGLSTRSGRWSTAGRSKA